MTKEYEHIGQLLDGLTGHGIYAIDLVVDQLPKYGFEYDAATDELIFGNRRVKLRSGTKAQVERSVARESIGGILDQNLADDDRLVDALALSTAVFRLLMPTLHLPSESYFGRGKGFRENVAAITEYYEKETNES